MLASAKLLGLLQQTPTKALESLMPERSTLPVARIEALVAEREIARQKRDYARADALRDELIELGAEVRDMPEGSRWQPLSRDPALYTDNL